MTKQVRDAFGCVIVLDDTLLYAQVVQGTVAYARGRVADIFQSTGRIKLLWQDHWLKHRIGTCTLVKASNCVFPGG